jgi:ABC-type dipeptide/oligopeptide/nickel transport system permease component
MDRADARVAFGLLTTLKEDFILLARAKGLPPWRVLLGHALRPPHSR